MELPSDKDASQMIREQLLGSNYKEAYQILKRNPMAPISIEDARIFLNNFSAFGTGNEKDQAEVKVNLKYLSWV